MSRPGHILIVEDVASHRQLLSDELSDRGHRVEAVESAEAALQRLAHGSPIDLIVSDLRLEGRSGLDLLQEVRAMDAAPGFVLLTGYGTVDQAVLALQAGADDFLTKPVNLDHLAIAVARVFEHRRLRDLVSQLPERGAGTFHGMSGRSEVMVRLFELIRRIAQADGNVLIHGESGTGKELVAGAVHAESPRSERPFVAINCGGIPESLLESELFGHVAGAFSGAKGARPGLFAAADGGSLFLDEIGELPGSMQAKLLRVLQDGRVRAVGADHETQVDVRVVAATHRDLRAEMQAGRFREDLFYRLQTFQISVPPLRERENDLVDLLGRFVAEFGARRDKPLEGLSSAAIDACLRYSWPGNVRELRSLAERMATLAPGPRVEFEDLPGSLRDDDAPIAPSDPGAMRRGSADPQAGSAATNTSAFDEPGDVGSSGAAERFAATRSAMSVAAPDALGNGGDAPTSASTSGWPTLAELEARHICRVLEAVDGNRARAARILGIGRKTLYRKLQAINERDPGATSEQDSQAGSM